MSPYVVLVTIKPEWVNVFQEYGIVAYQHCRIEDEYRRDWTDRVAREGGEVLYPEQLV